MAFITARVTEQSPDPFGQSQSGTATGTGFVVSDDGYLVTNAHVVEGASAVQVKIGDGETKTAKVVGTDTSTDIALLKVDPGGQHLVAALARRLEHDLHVGDADLRDRQPVRPRPHAHHRRGQRARAARSARRTASRSTT